MDFRGIPTTQCPLCEGSLFNISAQFDSETYEMVLYTLDAICVGCGALITAPTPLDLPQNKLDTDI
jgi:hypothetical protein